MIEQHYDFPGRFTPFKHQTATVEFLIRNPRAFVFNDIGTGKTLSALWAADFLQQRKAMGKVLIVSTLSTLWQVWADELFKTMPHLSFAILHGSKAKRLELLTEEHDFYIINHDGIKVLEAELVARKDITHVILDEGAQFRNKQTDKWKSLNKLCGPVTPEAETYHRTIWWMTGSPMPHAPTDIWAQCRIVSPALVPKYFSRFRDAVMYQQNQFKWSPRTGWQDYIYSLLADKSVRFVRDECLDLPPCVTEMRQCEMSAQQKKMYAQMKKDLLIEYERGEITAANEGVKRIKLLQIACGAIYTPATNKPVLRSDLNMAALHRGETPLPDTGIYAVDIKPKLKVLIETIEEAGNKALIFTPFKHSTKLLYNLLRSKYRCGMVTGDTGTGARTKIFSDFQHGDLQLIVAHPQTMAHGLTLTASSTVIWWGPINYEIYEQAVGRITRPGQTQKQTIIRLVCSDIEKLAYKRVDQAEGMQGLLLELLREK